MAKQKTDKEATRQERKVKKRKLEDAIPDVPGGSEMIDDLAVSVDELQQPCKKRKRSELIDASTARSKEEKTEKKRKKEERHESKAKMEAVLGDVVVSEEAAPRKSKKERKAERKAKEAAEKSAIEEATASNALTQESAIEATSQKEAELNTGSTGKVEKTKKNNRNREKRREAKKAALTNSDATDKEPTAARFIVFIGNLPFSATKTSIEKHFAAVKPKSVRHLTEKSNPTKSKGIAFVEFDGYDHMKTCLKLFHHSTFDDGISAPRKINVELSAGGGGNTKARKAKIGEKNQKLNEERARRMMEEEKAKLVKKDGAVTIDHNAVHPSRRARVPDVS